MLLLTTRSISNLNTDRRENVATNSMVDKQNNAPTRAPRIGLAHFSSNFLTSSIIQLKRFWKTDKKNSSFLNT